LNRASKALDDCATIQTLPCLIGLIRGWILVLGWFDGALIGVLLLKLVTSLRKALCAEM